MPQRWLGAELCAWAVTVWSPGILAGQFAGYQHPQSKPKLCCIRCFHLRNTLPLQEWTSTQTTASWRLRWRMDAAGAPKLTVFSKTFFVSAGNTISALMFTTFRQVKIQLTPPSRSRLDTDCMLSNSAWEQVDRLFGPHTFDLMSLDSSCQCNRVGLQLPHFTPCAAPESSGINVFAHWLFLWITISTCSGHLSL